MAKQRAYTLIELLVAIAISSVVAGVVTISFVGSWRSQLTQEAYSELQRGARFTLDEVSSQIRNSTTVVSGALPVVVGEPAFATTSSSIVLRLPPLNNDNVIITGDDYVTIYQNGSDVSRALRAAAGSKRASSQSAIKLNQETSSLLFRYFNVAGAELIPGTDDLSATKKITVRIRTSRLISGRTINRELEATVHLRNKGT